MSPLPTCIYCRATGPAVRFNREHVVPAGFCAGFSGVLVLSDAVCAACNQLFGETIDIALARDGPEGFERYRWGVRSAEEVRRFRYRLLDLRFPGDGHFKGVRLQGVPADVPGGLATAPVDGVSMQSADGSELVFFTAQEIESGSWLSNSKVDWRRGVRVFGPDPAVEQLRATLSAQGVTFESWEAFGVESSSSGQVEVEETATFSLDLRRAYAKIAFNYLAAVQGAEFVLSRSFDPIRAFIRDGVETGLPRVLSRDELPFRTDRPSHERPVVHFVSLSVAEHHRHLLGTVMLFGYMSHVVLLAQDFDGPWPELPRAHLYNVAAKAAAEMTPQFPRFRLA